jgi:hypothetical protein
VWFNIPVWVTIKGVDYGGVLLFFLEVTLTLQTSTSLPVARILLIRNPLTREGSVLADWVCETKL